MLRTVILPWGRGSLAAWVLAAMATASHAQAWYQMDSPEKVRTGLEAHAGKVHRFKPARVVRPLPPASPEQVVESLRTEGESFARGAYSALLIEDGKIVFEAYGQGAGADALHNAWSVTKSWTALAVGEALCAGKIRSLDDAAKSYAPQLAGTAYGEASLRNLLRYTSGAEDPGGNGYVGIHGRLEFNSMVDHRLSLVDLAKRNGGTSRFKPGEKFIYNGLDSEALSIVVREATGMPLPAWFEATVWQEAGGESPAAWFLDKDGNGIAEVLLFATSRDYARVALYVLDRLTDQAGSECIRRFVKEAAQPQVAKGYWASAPGWGFGLHTGADGQTWMFGAKGQRIGVNASRKRVFVTNNNRDSEAIDRGSQALLNR